MIRCMEERDLPAIAELEKLCFSESWSYSILEAGIHSPYDVYYVFEQEEKILGYCNLRVLAGEGEVQRIAVHPESRRLGLGRKMMDAMVEYAIRKVLMPSAWRYAKATLWPGTCMNPTVLPQRQCEKPTIITRPRMLSSCGSGICRKELPLKIANISVYNVGDAAFVPCPVL